MVKTPDKATKIQTAAPGQGIRSMDSTNLFRITNFELFVKPNKYVMAIGIAAISGCIAYITYMNLKNPAGKNQYVAISEDGQQYIRDRTSKWD